MNILIIEDEAKAARGIIKILAEIDNTIKIVAVIESVKDGLAWFKENDQPDLIFSDIQLSDGLCFDIYQNIKITSPIVFCTAFDEYIMQAFDTCAVSYLLKPVNREKIEGALDKYQAMQTSFHNDSIDKLMTYLKPAYKSVLLINYKEKIIPIQTKDIAFFHWDENALTLTTLKGQKYIYSASVDEMERLLDPVVFFRANRQYLINRYAIRDIERFFARKLTVKLTVDTPESVLIGKTKTSDFLKWVSFEN